MYYVLNMNHHHIVFVKQKMKDRWFFVNVAFSGIIVHV